MRIIDHQRIMVTPEHRLYEQHKAYWDHGYPFCGPTQALFSYKITQTSIGEEVWIRCNWSLEGENEWYFIGDDNW